MERFETRYQDELEYMRGLLGEFAQQFPEAAAEFDPFGPEPDSRRLLQAFSFLSARVRLATEQSPLQLLHPLVEQVWPHALRPTPAMGLVRFQPQPGLIRSPVVLPRHTLLFSTPLVTPQAATSPATPSGAPPQSTAPPEQVVCTFRTPSERVVFPATLQDLRVEGLGPERTRLTLQLEVFAGASLSCQKGVNDTLESGTEKSGTERSGTEKSGTEKPLCIQVVAPPGLSDTLTLALRRHVKSLRLRAFVGPQLEKVLERRLPLSALFPLGWTHEEALLPHPTPQSLTQRHLHEWLLFPQKFHAFGLTGLERLSSLDALRRLELELELTLDPARLEGLASGHLALHCVPVVNLFPHETRLSPHTTLQGGGTPAEHRLNADNASSEDTTRSSIEIYSVLGVRGPKRAGHRYEPWMGNTARKRPPGRLATEALVTDRRFPDAHSPDKRSSDKRSSESPVRYFAVRAQAPIVQQPTDRNQRPGLAEQQGTSSLHYLSLLEGDGTPLPLDTTLTVTLLCSNSTATRTLSPQALCVAGADMDAAVTFSGVGPLTASASADHSSLGLWEVFQALQRPWAGVESLEMFRKTLQYYSRGASAQPGVAARLEGILSAIVGLKLTRDVHVLGIPPSALSAWHLELSADLTKAPQTSGVSEGSVELFGEALFQYLLETTTRGVCVSLSIRLRGPHKGWEWAAQEGKRSLM